MLKTFHSASRREPCPICGKPDWCIISNDGHVAICNRIQSNHRCDGGGWLHVLEKGDFRPVRRVWTPPAKIVPTFDAEAVQAVLSREYERRGGDGMLADDISLPVEAVSVLGPGWNANLTAWSFPMRDAYGNVVGIRYREFNGSRKWAEKGSRNALIYPRGFRPLVVDGYATVVFCEGETDTMAAHALGIPAVGRPSCSSCVDMCRELCRRVRAKRVVVVSDNDKYKSRPGTDDRPPMRPWRPGIEGAESLAEGVGIPYRIVTPPCKDMREWYWSGLTAEKFWNCVRVMSVRMPKQKGQ